MTREERREYGREWDRRWWAENPEEAHAYQRRMTAYWRELNLELYRKQVRERIRRWRDRNFPNRKRCFSRTVEGKLEAERQTQQAFEYLQILAAWKEAKKNLSSIRRYPDQMKTIAKKPIPLEGQQYDRMALSKAIPVTAAPAE